MLRHIIQDIDSIKKAFQKNDIVKLKSISNNIIEKAAIKNDSLLAELSLIAYSLYKLISKVHIRSDPKFSRIKTKIIGELDKSMYSLKRKEVEKFKKDLKGIVNEIIKLDSKMGNYVKNIYENAKIKQASRAYAFGLSLSQAAQLTGSEKKNLQEYIGNTRMHDEVGITLGIKKRLTILKKELGL